MRIAIVDDEPLARSGLRALLAPLTTIEVVGEAATGHEALALCAAHTVDVMLLDIHMPGMGGYETCRRIRQLEAGGRRTLVIALTASVSRQTFGRCVDAGMDAQLQKPLDFGRLCKLIADHQAESETSERKRR